MNFDSLLDKTINESADQAVSAMICDNNDMLWEYELRAVDFERKSVKVDDNEDYPFSDFRYIIVQQPVFNTLDEYKHQNSGRDHLYSYRVVFNNGEAIAGRCVLCEKKGSIWHLLRLHEDHIFYILISELDVADISLTEIAEKPSFSVEDVVAASKSEVIDLDSVEIDNDLIKQFPHDVLFKFLALPLYQKPNQLYVAFANPRQIDAIQMFSFISGCVVEPVKVEPKQLQEYLSSLVQLQSESEAMSELERKGAINGHQQLATSEIEQLGKKKGIIRLMAQIIKDAIDKGASDIHLHPRTDHLQLLYRIDGALIPIRQMNLSLHQALVSRIKIIGGMDIAERRLPQDGRIEFTEQGANVDMRISVMPTVSGESVVIRILDSSKGMRDINELGLSEQDTETFRHLLHSSYGIFLVTGPTGSGKTTTLYAALKEKVKEGPHIITVEEPVEYQIDGINQIPVNTKTGYTFARALRNILRHDPDVIMVGEIRDGETAKIAVESALTGHLVLSTLHTNSAVSTITRLLEIGVEPYLLKDALVGVLAQRLVRRNCSHCLELEDVPDSIKKAIGANKKEKFYHGAGCSQCNNTGVAGRRSVYELLKVTPEMSNLIVEELDVDKLERQAQKQGMVALDKMALELARSKEISAHEVYAVRSNSG